MQAIAAPNVALIKYWGKGDQKTNSPASGSISLTLSAEALWAKTKVLSRDVSKGVIGPTMEINGTRAVVGDSLLRLLDGFSQCAHLTGVSTSCGSSTLGVTEELSRDISIVSQTNIPVASGVASSAAGAAALALALNEYYRTNFDRKTLSCLARLYSGSGARSMYPGAVEMVYDINAHPLLHWHAVPLAVHPSFHSLECLILLFSCTPKPLSSTEAMNRCIDHPSQRARLARVPARLDRCRSALQRGCFNDLAEVCEEDWKCMHSVVQEATGVTYIPEDGRTFSDWVTTQRRTAGLQAFCTYDAGPNCIVFGFPEDFSRIRKIQPHFQYLACKIAW
ncbi:Diphosphomevalonate decarboxylase [Giardia lamblia P15]|uniref:Diphosphomevalonate decarboxylase n=1 Tax=Giardia intestinalis (strain P15) TaxID=658858 RepID=E1EWR4_GIAIA|nr:Diphosphomevalonate decarboxylase [Giardia lamblia P15]